MLLRLTVYFLDPSKSSTVSGSGRAEGNEGIESTGSDIEIDPTTAPNLTALCRIFLNPFWSSQLTKTILLASLDDQIPRLILS